LYEIDFENKTAFCTVCGHTEIYIHKTRKQTGSKVYCIHRANQLKAKRKERSRRISEERQSKSGWKPRHALTEIDPEKLTAVCAICGPTKVIKTIREPYTSYYCANKRREVFRKYHRLSYISKSTNPLIHKLSEVDEVKKTAVCSRCGPVEIVIWRTKKKINRRCINAGKDGKDK
jgi:hypothetical protein